MAKASNASAYIFPSLLLVMGIVILILYIKGRKQQKANEDLGLASNDGSKYNFLSADQLKKLTTITI